MSNSPVPSTSASATNFFSVDDHFSLNSSELDLILQDTNSFNQFISDITLPFPLDFDTTSDDTGLNTSLYTDNNLFTTDFDVTALPSPFDTAPTLPTSVKNVEANSPVYQLDLTALHNLPNPVTSSSHVHFPAQSSFGLPTFDSSYSSPHETYTHVPYTTPSPLPLINQSSLPPPPPPASQPDLVKPAIVPSSRIPLTDASFNQSVTLNHNSPLTASHSTEELSNRLGRNKSSNSLQSKVLPGLSVHDIKENPGLFTSVHTHNELVRPSLTSTTVLGQDLESRLRSVNSCTSAHGGSLPTSCSTTPRKPRTRTESFRHASTNSSKVIDIYATPRRTSKSATPANSWTPSSTRSINTCRVRRDLTGVLNATPIRRAVIPPRRSTKLTTRLVIDKNGSARTKIILENDSSTLPSERDKTDDQIPNVIRNNTYEIARESDMESDDIEDDNVSYDEGVPALIYTTPASSSVYSPLRGSRSSGRSVDRRSEFSLNLPSSESVDYIEDEIWRRPRSRSPCKRVSKAYSACELMDNPFEQENVSYIDNRYEDMSYDQSDTDIEDFRNVATAYHVSKGSPFRTSSSCYMSPHSPMRSYMTSKHVNVPCSSEFKSISRFAAVRNSLRACAPRPSVTTDSVATNTTTPTLGRSALRTIRHHASPVKTPASSSVLPPTASVGSQRTYNRHCERDQSCDTDSCTSEMCHDYYRPYHHHHHHRQYRRRHYLNSQEQQQQRSPQRRRSSCHRELQMMCPQGPCTNDNDLAQSALRRIRRSRPLPAKSGATVGCLNSLRRR